MPTCYTSVAAQKSTSARKPDLLSVKVITDVEIKFNPAQECGLAKT